MNSKIKYAGMTLVAIAIYYLTIFIYCKIINYYYSTVIHVRTIVSYAVSQTSTILIVIICGATGAFILYQSQKNNKENIAKLVRLQLFTTAIWFTISITIYDLFCYVLLNDFTRWSPFLREMGMVYITATIWIATTLCFIHHIRQKKKTETNAVTNII
jgi:hypothetical protein